MIGKACPACSNGSPHKIWFDLMNGEEAGSAASVLDSVGHLRKLMRLTHS